MRAIILAGGKGTRLRPYTTLIPKPLVPLGGKFTILEIIIMQLREAGFTEITLAVNHLSNLIMAYFGDGARFGVKISYSTEPHDLGTVGPLRLIKDMPEDVLVMNGDVLTDLDFRKFFGCHCETTSEMTVAVFKRKVKIDFGVLTYGKELKIETFKEKPEYEFSVSMGVYCINKSLVDSLEPSAKYGFDDLVLDRLDTRKPVNVFPYNGFWLDIGRPEDYDYANDNYNDLEKILGIE